MSELESADPSPQEAQEWDDVNELLDDVDQQLETIEETIEDVAIAGEETIVVAPVEGGAEEQPDNQSDEPEKVSVTRAQADQVFTIFATLSGIAAIAIAVLLGMALRVHNKRLPV